MANSITIAKGDTLSGLAQTHGTDVATLAKLNNIQDPNKIQAGATLNLPDAPGAVPLVNRFSGTGGVSTSDSIRSQDATASAEKAKADAEQAAELARTERAARIADLKKTYGLDAAAPAAPNLADTYTKLRTEKGVDSLDGRLNELKASELKIQDEFKKYKESQNGLGHTQGFVDGTVSEEAKKFQDQQDAITREKTQVVDQIQAANSAIDMMMKYTQQDYATAKADYDGRFQRASQMQSFLSAGDAEANRERDDARAYLSSVTGMIANGGQSFATLDPAMKAEVQKMELKAGFPMGTLEAFTNVKPKANLLATVNGTDAAGNNVISFVYQDENGQPGIVQTVKTGTKAKPTGTGTTSTVDHKKAAITKARPALERTKGKDGFVDPSIYLALRSDYAQAIGDPSSFDDTFSSFLSPQERARLGVGKATGVKATDSSDALF